MNSSGLHVYLPNEPRKSNITFINTVLENMKAFNKREIKRAKTTRQLYTKMLYPSNTGFIWMIKNNQISKCDAMVREIDVSQEIWGKDIDALKVKTTRGYEMM